MPQLQLLVDSQAFRALDVRRAAVDEALNVGFVATIEAVSLEPNLDVSQFVGKASKFVLSPGYGFSAGSGERTWTGVCQACVQTDADPDGLSTYEFRIVPRLWLLSQRRGHRLFQHLSIPEVVGKLLGEWNVEHEFRIDPARYPKLALVVQYGESDANFMRRLLEHAGITTWIADAGESLLVLSDAPSAEPQRPSVRFVQEHVGLIDYEYVRQVRVARQTRPNAYELRDTDFRRPSYSLVTQARAKVTPTLEHYEYAPGGLRVEVKRDNVIKDEQDLKLGQQLTEQALAEFAFDETVVSFETNAIDLAPGVRFSVGEPPHPNLDGTPLLVTEARFVAASTTEFSWQGKALLSTGAYYPPRVTKKPVVHGVQSATVVGPPGETIHTDEWGRVRVQFPWDRDPHPTPDDTSCWMRVSQGWAGRGYGQLQLPRVGQEVLVSFLRGDPDQPVVVGRVFNATQPVPEALPDNKTQSIWRSDVALGPQGTGYNQIVFEDKQGEELVHLQAQKKLRRLTKNDETHTVGHDRNHVVRGTALDTTVKQRVEATNKDRLEAVGRNKLTVNAQERKTLTQGTAEARLWGSQRQLNKQDVHLTVQGERFVQINTDRHLVVKGKVSVQIGGSGATRSDSFQERLQQSYFVDSNRHIHLVARDALIGDAPDITLKGPGGFIRIDDAGVVIKGKKVKINNGGKAGNGPGVRTQEPKAPKEPEADLPFADDLDSDVEE